MTYLITSAFVGPIQQMRMFGCLYAYSRLGFSHDYSCHRYTAASSLSQSFHPYHKARALNQSISVLFYVCSQQRLFNHSMFYVCSQGLFILFFKMSVHNRGSSINQSISYFMSVHSKYSSISQCFILGLFTASTLQSINILFYVCSQVHFSQSVFCLLYTSPSPRDRHRSRMPSSA